VERAAVGQGDLVLIHAGAGGTGQMATQIARAMGARVATTVSSAEKAELSLAAGAERAIRYKDEDFCAAVMDWSGGDGVRAVLDNIGGDGFLNSLRVLQPYGHIVTLMGTPGDLPDGTAHNGNLTVHNVMMLTPMWKGLKSHLIRQAAILQRAMDWLAEGKVFVCIQDRFPLVKADEAHRLLERAGGSGKVILTMPAE
jgi:NADPH2:quinone reductase